MGIDLTAEDVAEARQMASRGDAQIQFKLGKVFKLYPALGQPGEFRQWLAQAAGNGVAPACWELAEVYLHGTLAAQDFSEAHAWLKQGAALKDPVCAYNLGVQYLQGNGVPQNDSLAFKHFQLAAELGSRDGLYNVAVCFCKGTGTPQNLKIARDLAVGVAAAGDPRGEVLAQAITRELEPATVSVNLSPREAADLTRALISQQMASHMEDLKRGAAEKARTAATPPPLPQLSPLDRLKNQARAGDPQAQLELAKSLQASQRLEEAAAWLSKAAAAGNVEAQFILGNCLLEGRGVPVDIFQARALFQAAANQGHRLAPQALPQIDAHVAKLRAAARELHQAADAGNAEAQYNLGLQYSRGTFAPADPRAAIHYLEKAANQNHAAAQVALFVIFEQGKGVQPDLARSRFWLGKAAGLGHTDAMYYFARRYAEGKITFGNVAHAREIFARCQFLYPQHLDPAVPKKTIPELEAGAARGEVLCIFWLAQSCLTGDGVPLSPAEGVRWLQKAADLGYAPAQLELARCLARGEGLPVDREKGKHLAILAARQGHLEARADLVLGFGVKEVDLPKILGS